MKSFHIALGISLLAILAPAAEWVTEPLALTPAQAGLTLAPDVDGAFGEVVDGGNSTVDTGIFQYDAVDEGSDIRGNRGWY